MWVLLSRPCEELRDERLAHDTIQRSNVEFHLYFKGGVRLCSGPF